MVFHLLVYGRDVLARLYRDVRRRRHARIVASNELVVSVEDGINRCPLPLNHPGLAELLLCRGAGVVSVEKGKKGGSCVVSND